MTEPITGAAIKAALNDPREWLASRAAAPEVQARLEALIAAVPDDAVLVTEDELASALWRLMQRDGLHIAVRLDEDQTAENLMLVLQEANR